MKMLTITKGVTSKYVTLDHKTSHKGQFFYLYITWKLNN